MKLPKRPETFADALNYYLYMTGFEEIVPDEVRRAIWDANPGSWSLSPAEKEWMFKLLLAFAVKERQS